MARLVSFKFDLKSSKSQWRGNFLSNLRKRQINCCGMFKKFVEAWSPRQRIMKLKRQSFVNAKLKPISNPMRQSLRFSKLFCYRNVSTESSRDKWVILKLVSMPIIHKLCYELNIVLMCLMELGVETSPQRVKFWWDKFLALSLQSRFRTKKKRKTLS